MTEKIRILLVDDEPLALRGLAMRLAQYDDIEIVATCRNGREAIKAAKTERPDALFLDIQMPGLDGFDVVESLVGAHMPLIVFITAYDEFAIKAFDNHAVDYLLKPVEDARLKDALYNIRTRIREKRAMEQNSRLIEALHQLGKAEGVRIDALAAPAANGETRYESRINIKDRGQIICVDVGDIEWIDAAGDYMCIHACGETHILRETMKSMEKRLDPQKFQRVHRSTIVNLDKVKELHPYTNGECFLILESGGEIKVSRSYRNVVNRFL